MVSKERKVELFELWLNELDDEEWREDLSREELPLVDRWDQQYVSGAYQLCLKILQTEQLL